MNKMIKFGLLFLAIVVTLGVINNMVFASSENKPVYLVFDSTVQNSLPKNFRSTSQPLLANAKFSSKGYEQLHLIGSAQFSAGQLKLVLAHVTSLAPIIIVDLRQEAHGYLNQDAISWYGYRNINNIAKSARTIEFEQAKLLNALSEAQTVTVYQIKEKFVDGDITVSPTTIAVDSVMSEQVLAEKLNLAYKRFYVADHHQPTNAQMDDFIEFYRQLPRHNRPWIYFHCRGGKGRTAMFMVLVDMMNNAKTVSFNDMILRQIAIGGIDLRKMPSTKSYKYKLAIKRFKFLKTFYQYSKENHDQFRTLWSDWLNQTHAQTR
jgi:protein-tyrosine phosphatase